MTLQLLSFLNLNFVEYIAINVCTAQGEERYIKDRFILSVTEKAATTIL